MSADTHAMQRRVTEPIASIEVFADGSVSIANRHVRETYWNDPASRQQARTAAMSLLPDLYREGEL